MNRTSDILRGLDMATRDARSLSTDALEALRRRAVAAVEAGASRAEVARLFGVSRKTVGAWVLAYRQQGDDAFRPKTRGRRPGEQLALSPARQAWTVQTIIAGPPDNHGMPHRLWTRQAIAELVNREFRILLSPTTVAQYLVRWGLIEEPRVLEMMRGRVTSVVPSQRSTRAVGDPWLPDAEVVWVAWTKPHAPMEQKRQPGQNLMSGFRNYFGDVNVLLAMSNRGVVYFQAGLGPFGAAQAGDFLNRLMTQLGRGLNVIVCRWPLPHYEILRSWPEEHADKISLRFTLG
jgi:transposase